MTIYLTSSPCTEGNVFTEANGFRKDFMQALAPEVNALFITAAPADKAFTEHCAQCMKECLEEAGVNLVQFNYLDNDNREDAPTLVAQSNLIIVGGGHVPTQNRFLHETGLPQLMENYQGVVMGISAGSMNCATEVYAEPEEPGEAIDPDFQRFLPGLGLTPHQIMPHYNQNHDARIDGLHLYEEIARGDSYGRCIFILPDGSYISSHEGYDEVHGEAWIMAEGEMSKLCEDGETIVINE